MITEHGWLHFPDALSGRMPLGISFLIFTLLAYLIDAKKQRITADHNMLDVFVHQLFFAKLISDPITRFGQFYQSFREVAFTDEGWLFYNQPVMSDDCQGIASFSADGLLAECRLPCRKLRRRRLRTASNCII